MKAAEHPGVARLPGLGSIHLKSGVGGTWTPPEGTTPKIGLISLGKQDPNDVSATARFDYFSVYRP